MTSEELEIMEELLGALKAAKPCIFYFNQREGNAEIRYRAQKICERATYFIAGVKLAERKAKEKP